MLSSVPVAVVSAASSASDAIRPAAIKCGLILLGLMLLSRYDAAIGCGQACPMLSGWLLPCSLQLPGMSDPIRSPDLGLVLSSVSDTIKSDAVGCVMMLSSVPLLRRI